MASDSLELYQSFDLEIWRSIQCSNRKKVKSPGIIFHSLLITERSGSGHLSCSESQNSPLYMQIFRYWKHQNGVKSLFKTYWWILLISSPKNNATHYNINRQFYTIYLSMGRKKYSIRKFYWDIIYIKESKCIWSVSSMNFQTEHIHIIHTKQKCSMTSNLWASSYPLACTPLQGWPYWFLVL